MFWQLLKKLVFRFDAETAHRLGVVFIRALSGLGHRPLRILAGSAPASRAPDEGLPRVLGMTFANRVGLAAGFDKNAEIVGTLPDLGFGFAEIGTVTPKPQPGNPRPRLFRDPARGALFNCLGFNNLGAIQIANTLEKARKVLPEHFRVGVNVGKNKDTPLEDAAADYSRAIQPFLHLADYAVINVSSPNTPGLRSLQTVESLKPIVESVKNVLLQSSSRQIPLLLKLAPELEGIEYEQILTQGPNWGVQGWILTNTWGGTLSLKDGKELRGGWSGAPLTLRSRLSLSTARSQTSLPIISVGGILDSDEAVTRRKLGADLIQIYTGWVYGGPRFPQNLAKKPDFRL